VHFGQVKSITGVPTAAETKSGEVQFGQNKFDSAHDSVAMRARWDLLL